MARLTVADIKQGSDADVVEYQVSDGGVPIDVAGSTVTCTWVNRDTGAVVVAPAAGIIVDAGAGVVGYQPVPADVATPQPIAAQFTIVYPSGQRHVSLDIYFAILPAR